MTHKQKDNQLLEEAYSKILEGKMPKCPECGCNPSEPKEECDCDHDCDHDEHEHKKDTVEEAKAKSKGKRPDYPDVDKDGDTKEPMSKALKEKGKHTAPPKKGKTKKTVAESLEDAYDQIILENKI